jgi:5-(carboxyamino)imidazole ribonucleotide synthase
MVARVNDTTIGVLGAGQLSRMLAEAAGPLGLHVLALGEKADDPASEFAEIVLGKLDDEAALGQLFDRTKTIVLENEFVDCAALERAGKPRGVRFVPALGAISVVQDKIGQKRLLASAQVPSAPWIARETGEVPAAFAERARQAFGPRFVLKWARLGYDGKGVFLGEEGRAADAAAFCARADERGIEIFAEQRVLFKRELAMVAALSIHGKFVHWPLVVSRQESGICRTVSGPASGLGVPPSIEVQAARACERVARALELHGVFAIEFFETDGGELLANEIAPRVHNSGHYTQDASQTSQFENHWRAVLGRELGETTSAPGFVMVNLIGPPGVSRAVGPGDLPEPLRRGKIHWYGKRELRDGRKMGHLNAEVASASDVPALVKELEEARSKWESRVMSSAPGTRGSQ